MELHESAEDYLETILKIKDTRGAVRSIDVATELGFSKPSVSVAMKKLRETGYITVDPDGSIELTQQGHTAAANVYERHKCLTAFLMSIGVSEKNAFMHSKLSALKSCSILQASHSAISLGNLRVTIRN